MLTNIALRTGLLATLVATTALNLTGCTAAAELTGTNTASLNANAAKGYN